MNEIDAILCALENNPMQQDAVLATVVRVRGSAYRRAGARMLLFPDGRRIGSISGGCLESDVCRKAWWLTGDGEPALRIYDTTSDEGAVREFGLGCNGVVDVLIERLSRPSARETLNFLKHCRAVREAGVIAHILRGSDAAPEHRFHSSSAQPVCDIQVRETLLAEESRYVVTENAEIFYEFVAPPIELAIFGAGYDAVPLVQFAKALGWHVTIADSRPATAGFRYPGFDGVIPFEEVHVTERSSVVLMTHNYEEDCNLLRRVLPAGPKYLGVLGPRHRTEQLFADLGVSTDWASLHGPVGLDIGADSPEAIALSIVAEIQAVLNSRSGGMLRLRSGPIYRPMCELVA